MKNLAKDERGLTLIELVVVMVISVILMGIAGSIILSSTGFFTKVTISDQDKLATDKIVELVDGEIMYATNVIVSNKEPNELDIKGENWHYFKFEKGRLYIGTVFYDSNQKIYRNSEAAEALSDSYYNNRNLVVKAKGYSNSYRLDLTYFFNNADDEEEYKTKSTIAFPNLKLQYDSATTKKGWFDSVDYDSIDINFFYIYYNKTEVAVNTDDTSKYSGTVADHLDACKVESNDDKTACKDWGEYSSIPNKAKIKKGDFVKVTEGDIVSWFRYTGEGGYSGSGPISSDGYWQLIYISNQKSGEEGQWSSVASYYQGDVVRYPKGFKEDKNNEKGLIYYSSKENKGGTSDNYPNIDSSFRKWAPVYIDVYREAKNHCNMNLVLEQSSTYSLINHTYILNTPYAKLYPNAQLAEKESQVNVLENGASFIIKSAYDIDKLTPEYILKEGDDYYIYMKKGTINVSSSNAPSKDKSNSWQKLQVLWDDKSSYKAGDVVFYSNGNVSEFFVAVKDVMNGDTPKRWETSPWIRVYWDAIDGKWIPNVNN